MRERILSAAAKVFAKRGYERTRVADITKAAKTSHGNFYRHFRNKDEVLIAAVGPPLDELQSSFELPSVSPAMVDEEAFARHSVASFKVYARHRKLLRVMREASARGEQQSSFYSLWMSARARFIKRNADWLARLKAEGHLAPEFDPELTAEMLLALREQVAYVKIGLAAVTPSDAEIERLGRHCAMIWYRSVFGHAGKKPTVKRELVHAQG